MQLSTDLTDGTSTSCTHPQAGEDGKPCLLSIFHVPGLSRTPSVNPYNDPAIFISLTLQIKAAHRNAPRAARLARSRRGRRTRACPTPTSSSANPDVTAGPKRVDGSGPGVGTWMSIAASSHRFQGRLFALQLWLETARHSSPRESQIARIQASGLPDAPALARESLMSVEREGTGAGRRSHSAALQVEELFLRTCLPAVASPRGAQRVGFTLF